MRPWLRWSGLALVVLAGAGAVAVWALPGPPRLVWQQETPSAHQPDFDVFAVYAPAGQPLPEEWRGIFACGTPARPYYDFLRPARTSRLSRLRSWLGLGRFPEAEHYPTDLVVAVGETHWRAYAQLYGDVNWSGSPQPDLEGRWRCDRPYYEAEFELFADGRIVASGAEGRWHVRDGMIEPLWNDKGPHGMAWVLNRLVVHEGRLYGNPGTQFARVP